jgi:hypothetical protein
MSTTAGLRYLIKLYLRVGTTVRYDDKGIEKVAGIAGLPVESYATAGFLGNVANGARNARR